MFAVIALSIDDAIALASTPGRWGVGALWETARTPDNKGDLRGPQPVIRAGRSVLDRPRDVFDARNAVAGSGDAMLLFGPALLPVTRL